MTISLDDFVRKGEGQIETDIGTETILMRVESGLYFSMDGVARSIWASIIGVSSVRAIIDEQLENLDVDRSRAEGDILTFLNDLLAQRLIERVRATDA